MTGIIEGAPYMDRKMIEHCKGMKKRPASLSEGPFVAGCRLVKKMISRKAGVLLYKLSGDPEIAKRHLHHALLFT